MTFFRRMLLYILALLMLSLVHAREPSNKMFRTFLLPTYHGLRLDYCLQDGSCCGEEVANRYCRVMGYQYANQQIIEHNVGLTNFLFAKAQCKGWHCNGFKAIRCVTNLSHKPYKPYYYRARRFVFPRYNNYRIAWCYTGKTGCGRRAAYSFCRRLGFIDVRRYALEPCVAATKAIGNQKLCFGKKCKAFQYIDCYR